MCIYICKCLFVIYIIYQSLRGIVLCFGFSFLSPQTQKYYSFNRYCWGGEINFISIILVWISIVLIKQFDHKKLWDEKVYFSLKLRAYSCQVTLSLKEAMAGTEGKGHSGILLIDLFS